MVIAALGAGLAVAVLVLLLTLRSRKVITIAQLLDDCSFPWRVPRQDLIARFGITTHPAYGWEEIAVSSERPPVRGLIYPLSAGTQKNLAAHLPAIHFTSCTWFGPDARRNFRRTERELARKLGQPRPDSHSNTVGCIWQSGAASIRLIAWPKDLDTLPRNRNPAVSRDPRLGQACHIVIETGFKPPLSDAERTLLDNFTPFAELASGHHFDANSIRTRPAFDLTLEFVREPPDDLSKLFRQIGFSADRTTLIFCHQQLYVVPVDQIAGLLHVRLKPVRGPGGARVILQCKPAEPGQPFKEVTVDDKGVGPSALDGFAAQLAALLGKPLTVAEGRDD